MFAMVDHIWKRVRLFLWRRLSWIWNVTLTAHVNLSQRHEFEMLFTKKCKKFCPIIHVCKWRTTTGALPPFLTKKEMKDYYISHRSWFTTYGEMYTVVNVIADPDKPVCIYTYQTYRYIDITVGCKILVTN